MKLLGLSAWILLICFSAMWDSLTSEEAVPHSRRPSACGSTLTFSSGVLSLSEGKGDIHQTSLSPWTWRSVNEGSTTVKNQIPSTLWEAVCTSVSCSHPNPGQTDIKNLNSVPVYQNILVLNQKDGSRCYTASYRSMAVGCTCVWAEQS